MNTEEKYGQVVQEQLKTVNDCARYAKDLVDRMLTFSRQKKSEFKLIHPHVFVEDALSLARSFIPASITLNAHINQSCDPLMADPVQAHQIVMNLISNACHAMEDHGGVLTVTLDQVEIDGEDKSKQLKPGGYVRIRVEDNGPGIPEDVLDRVFDLFFSTKKEGQGSGIGLSVVHGIVQSHEGHICVSSKRGSGTCFKVYMPLYCGDLKIETPVKKDRPVLKGDESILLVDDDKKMAFMVQYMLRQLGYQVRCCLNSRQALEQFEKSPQGYDLLITDLTMPDLNGYQLAEKIHSIRSDMPIILCTGFGEHIDTSLKDRHGIQGVLSKPISVKSVSELIRAVLDKTVS